MKLKWLKTSNSLDELKDSVQISCIDTWEKKCFFGFLYDLFLEFWA